MSERRRPLLVGSHFFLPAQMLATKAFEAAYASFRVRRDVSGPAGMMREALAQVAEGSASAEDIDRAVRFGFGLRFMVRGPLAQRDLAGLDLASRIQTNPDDRERLDAGRQYLLELAAAGHLASRPAAVCSTGTAATPMKYAAPATNNWPARRPPLREPRQEISNHSAVSESKRTTSRYTVV